MKRTRTFNMRLNDEEMNRLRALAEHYEVSEAALIRLLLKQRIEELR